MTLLHHAVREEHARSMFSILEKCPEMASIPTARTRNPPRWTALQILSDKAQPAGQEGSARFMRMASAVLVANMSASALNNRGKSWATASHMAISRGNFSIVKKILWRLVDLGGYEAAIQHVNLQNGTVP